MILCPPFTDDNAEAVSAFVNTPYQLLLPGEDLSDQNPVIIGP